MKLEGKTAWANGAGSGMGRAAATHFASEGANAVVAGIHEVREKRVTQEILNRGGHAVFVKTDAAVEESARVSIETAITGAILPVDSGYSACKRLEVEN